jgi:23S rRNA (cytosine1962-C5)-methyltransferase
MVQESTKSPQIQILTSSAWKDYELLDSGNGRKLERFGQIILDRPEAEAFWSSSLPSGEWKTAHASFQVTPEENGGHWIERKPLPKRWMIEYRNLKFWVQTSASRHVGVFPEQASQWDWIQDVIRRSENPLRVLNLFGYTGLASLAALSAGANVTHLDAAKKIVSWAKDNQIASNLTHCPIRWIVDDAMKFVERENRRGNSYDAIILDPPKFGRGPKGEVWEFYKIIPDLLEGCRKLLSVKPRFFLLTAYAVKTSAITLYNAVEELMKNYSGETSAGEVALCEKSAQRLLSMAVYARWKYN